MDEAPGSGAADEPVTVFLLDDHELVRRGVRTLLEAEPDIVVVGESGSAVEAAARIPELRPRVAVLDGRLPDGTGIDVCRQVRSADPGIAVLILTSYDDDDAVLGSIMAGASGYVLKQIGGNELVTGVRRVAAGMSLLDPAITANVLTRLREGRREPFSQHLTPKEEQVLDLVAEGLTNRQVAERLGVAEKTVKNYVSTLLGKLGVESRTQAAVLAARRSSRGPRPGAAP
jgi:DNA-binding NarL/FixJ family response regulator